MKRQLLCLALASTPLFVQAQRPAAGGSSPAGAAPAAYPATEGRGKLTGTVLDADTQKPVPFATVALLNAAGKPVDGTVADDNGKFALGGIAAGRYTVQISFIGYKALDKAGVVFGEQGETVNLGTVDLAS